jgi:DegT/DnrJ/EryC1/StrS aminotransferase family protein
LTSQVQRLDRVASRLRVRRRGRGARGTAVIPVFARWLSENARTNIQAAIGCAQLEQAEAILGRRKAIAAAYEAGLAGIQGLTRAHGVLGRECVLDVLRADRARLRARPRRPQGRPPWRASIRGRSLCRSTRSPPYRLDAPFPIATTLGAVGHRSSPRRDRDRVQRAARARPALSATACDALLAMR